MGTNGAPGPGKDASRNAPHAVARKDAWQLTGGLSQTSKMPCHSWGLPASHCHTGAALAKQHGTVCHDCYAQRGKYTWRNVRNALERRLEHATHPDWATAMTTLVHWQAAANNAAYFRWFDSGDLQDLSMLERIATVARATPGIQHWLPTREYSLVEQYVPTHGLPDNLTLRVSAHRIDQAPPRLAGLPTSTVHRHEPIGYACPAYANVPARCGPCRACWNPGIENVSYPYH